MADRDRIATPGARAVDGSAPSFGDPRLPDRFWTKVQPDPSGCWLWTAQINALGYGIFRWPRPGKSYNARAHRLAYEKLIAEVADDLVCDHLCRVRHCVNPAHIEPVTTRTNVLRGVGPSAQAAQATHCPQGHEYTPENTMIRRKRYGVKRECHQCNRDRAGRLWRAGQTTKQKKARGEHVAPRNKAVS